MSKKKVSIIKKISLQKNYITKIDKYLRELERSKSDLIKNFSTAIYNYREIYKLLNKIQFSLELTNELKMYLNRIILDCNLNESKFIKNLSYSLKLFCDDKKLQFSGSFPEFTCSFINFRIDLTKNEVDFYFGIISKFELVGKCSILLEEIKAKLINIYDAIVNSKFSQENFLKKIYSIYNSLRNQKVKESQGSILHDKSVNIGEIFLQLTRSKDYFVKPKTKHFIDCTRAIFCYNLWRLKQSKIEGKVLVKVTASREETSLKSKTREKVFWIPRTSNLQSGELISGIKFINWK